MREQDLIEKVKNGKGRMTKTRYAIIEILKGSESPLAATDIQSRLERIGLEPDRATVYRQLDFLVQTGILREVMIRDNTKRFEYIDDSHTHHLVCTNCQNVINVELEDHLETLESELKNKHNFTIEHHTLEFYGRCKDCR